MLEVQGLQCVRDERLLFDDLSLQLAAGQALEIRGHNGCGKSSLLKILAGLRSPEAGQIVWCEQPIEDCQAYDGDLLYLGHQNALKTSLSAQQNLEFWLQMDRSAQAAAPLLAQVGLEGFQQRRVGSLSAGQKRRVTLARLLASSARLWLLDEPFTALDVQAQQALQRLLQRQVEAGGIVVFTTHQRVDWSLTHRVLQLTGGGTWQCS